MDPVNPPDATALARSSHLRKNAAEVLPPAAVSVPRTARFTYTLMPLTSLQSALSATVSKSTNPPYLKPHICVPTILKSNYQRFSLVTTCLL
jgi:hypothetical protein